MAPEIPPGIRVQPEMDCEQETLYALPESGRRESNLDGTKDGEPKRQVNESAANGLERTRCAMSVPRGAEVPRRSWEVYPSIGERL
jgi:hypothetical protein